MRKSVLLALIASLLLGHTAVAADYYCEVMTLQGRATVTSSDGITKDLVEGHLLKAGDLIKVASDGQVDLAFDREWNNITRLWANTEVRIRSIYPTGLSLDRGDVFSKLGKLPKGTTFEIQTPSAVAAVRGTEFLTSVSDKGETSVVSYEHAVEVFNLDANGALGSRVLVDESQKTVVSAMGEPPAPPAPAPKEDMERAGSVSGEIKVRADEMTAEGRFANVQSAGSVEAVMKMNEIFKATEGDDRPTKDDDQKPAGPPSGPGPGQGDANGSAPGAGNGPATTLSPDQLQTMKDNFVKLGGNESDFKFAQSTFSTAAMDPAKFDRFNTTTASFIANPDSLMRDPSMAFTTAGSFTSPGAETAPMMPPPPGTTGTFDPAMMTTIANYQPPAMTSIENQMNQVTNQITTTTTTASYTPPCISGTDCSGSYVTKYHTDGSPCTQSNPC